MYVKKVHSFVWNIEPEEFPGVYNPNIDRPETFISFDLLSDQDRDNLIVELEKGKRTCQKILLGRVKETKSGY